MNRITLFTFIVGSLLCSACAENNGHKKKLESELRLFKEKSITLPDNMLAKHSQCRKQ